MPSYYRYQCLTCGYDEVRYRNMKRCPECGEALERITKQCICFHGTNEKAASNILKDGFEPDTWFARHLEDSIFYGGLHVFEVAFEIEKLPTNWQIHHLEEIPADRIIGYHIFTKRTVINKEKLRDGILLSHYPMRK